MPPFLGVFQPPTEPTPNRSGSLSKNPSYLVEIKSRWKAETGTKEVSILANIPEMVQVQARNDWDSLFPRGGGEEALAKSRGAQRPGVALLGAGASFLRTIFGQTGIFKAATAQVWHGTAPMEFQLNLQWDAYDDPMKDVILPVKTLLELASPYTVNPATMPGGFITNGIRQAIGAIATFIGVGNLPPSLFDLLHAPGPSLVDVVTAANNGSARTTTPGLLNVDGAITLAIGRSILLPSVVILDVQLEQPSRFTAEGLPISMTATVSFRMFAVVGREDINDFFW